MAYNDKLSIRYLEMARHPVTDQAYAGEDIRFSTLFETLESELGGAQSILGPSNIDWSRIREGSERILVNQSKDLRVASWLTWALYECESFAGLLAGLGLIHHLCDKHWQVLYPRKSRTRCAAIGWLVLRLEKLLVEDIAITRQLPVFQQMVKYLDSLDELFGRYLVDEAPLLLPIRRRLTRMIQRAIQVEKEPVTVVEQVKQVAAQLFSSNPHIDNEKDAQRALGTLEESARNLCLWWLKQKSTDSRAFRLARSLVWLEVDDIPGYNAEKVTQLRALPADKLRNYKERFEQGLYADLIVDVEAALVRAPFWFDGQRLIWQCLKALDADAAMREVEAHVALFIKRMPEVIGLYFQDGTPFADAETRKWMAIHAMPPASPANQAHDTDKPHNQPEWEAVYGELVDTLPENGLKAAVQIMSQHLNRANGERDRFFWRLCLARLCHHAKNYELAKIQLEFLDQTLQSAGLHTWEPRTSLDVLRLLYDCYGQLPHNESSVQRKAEIHQRLCHYDLERLIA
ncbi:type VI secretion system ImpA domain-containing protein [Pseudomonas syringae]|uniref:Type VI secretion system ImpA domain-containing protein n=1 Tax=Pseudomonas syringae TaxID=317 RepID=A0A244EW39_PSESX|nr:type VI secretion system protein TssA [Pseudomonas syringae]OUM08751.1 type VI secretion system ImpA domain-containing protein [Pseudomonas syringae]